MYHTICGHRYKIEFKSSSQMRKNDGECDNPKKKNKKIKICKDLVPKRELEVIIHELLHGSSYFTLSEEMVSQTAIDISSLLWRLGYRRVEI